MYKITLLCLAGLVVVARASVAPSPVEVVDGLDQEHILDQEHSSDQEQPEFTFDLTSNADKPLNALPAMDRMGLSADVNDYVDTTIHMIMPLLQKHGLDPMELPEVVEGFSVRPLLITYSAWLKIHNGEMTGLSLAQRRGDQMVHYFANMLRVRIVLDFTDLVFYYDYLVQVMNIGPTGGIRATLDSFVVVVDVLIDFNNDEIHLQEFSITEIGRLRVRFVGNILYDWLINSVLGVFVRIFDTVIIKFVEVTIRNAVNSAIAYVNLNIKEIVTVIEAYNH